jgi:hypothetical protein
MIPGSRASGAARPLSWTAVTEWPVWRSEATIQAQVNAAGPATPAMAPGFVQGVRPTIRAMAPGPTGRTPQAIRAMVRGLDDVGVRMADSGTTVRQVPARPAGAPAAGRPG